MEKVQPWKGQVKLDLAAFLVTAQGRAAMRAGVQEGMQFAGLVTRDHDGLATHEGAEIIVRIGYLALVRQIDPVALENVFHFKLEQLLVGEDRTVDAVVERRRIVLEKVLEFCGDFFLNGHCVSSLLSVAAPTAAARASSAAGPSGPALRPLADGDAIECGRRGRRGRRQRQRTPERIRMDFWSSFFSPVWDAFGVDGCRRSNRRFAALGDIRSRERARVAEFRAGASLRCARRKWPGQSK